MAPEGPISVLCLIIVMWQQEGKKKTPFRTLNVLLKVQCVILGLIYDVHIG